MPSTRRGRRQFFSSLLAGGAVVGGASRARAAASERPAAVFDVTAFGAVRDGKTSTTAALQRALDACGKAGGGVVLVPPGRYLTGALFLCNNLELHLAAGATLLASQRFADFPIIDGRWEGIERKTHASLLTGERLENVTISGAGLLDGQGGPWWEAFEATHKMRMERGLKREAPDPPEAPLKYPCPRLINLIRCQRVAVSGISLENAPSWNLHLIYCQDVVIEGLNMVGLHAQEACGVVVDSSKRVRVTSCSIAAGSDCIGIKAGYNEDGRRVGLPCEDVIVSDCHLYDSFASGISIGSETAAGIKNITISNCVIGNCNTAFHVRSARGRGGGIERVRVSNCIADDIAATVVVIHAFYDSVRMESYPAAGTRAHNIEVDRAVCPPADEGTPTFRDLDFSGLSVGTTGALASIEGLPERFFQSVTLERTTVARSKKGVSLLNASGVSMRHLRLDPLEGALVEARNVEQLQVEGLTRVGTRPAPTGRLVDLDNVAGAYIHGCVADAPMSELVRSEGGGNHDIVIGSNAVPEPAPVPVVARARRRR
jgi:polygalacturonase